MPVDLLPPPVLSVRNLRTKWSIFKHITVAPLPSNPSANLDDDQESDSFWSEVNPDSRDVVNEIVVDRLWSEYPRLSVENSDWGVGSALAKDSLPASGHSLGNCTPPDPNHSRFWTWFIPPTIIRWRLWPALIGFFSSRFCDDLSERHYQQESWYIKKSLAIWASLFLVSNWILGCALFIHQPVALPDKIFYFGVAPVLTFPVLFMILYNLPRYHSNFYQTILLLSTWSWSFYQVLFIYFCGFYDDHPGELFSCGSKDFMDTFYYTAAMQTIGLFGLRLNRFPATVGAVAFMIFSCATIVPQHKATWGRNMVNFAVYQSFLIYLHYRQEHAERRLYNLRDQLRLQFKATQKAQVNERKTADSKRRLTSYVFHDKSF